MHVSSTNFRKYIVFYALVTERVENVHDCSHVYVVNSLQFKLLFKIIILVHHSKIISIGNVLMMYIFYIMNYYLVC